MSRNQKVQVAFTLMILPFILGICLFGAKFLTDTIYLFLVQESVAADTSLMKQILGLYFDLSFTTYFLYCSGFNYKWN